METEQIAQTAVDWVVAFVKALVAKLPSVRSEGPKMSVAPREAQILFQQCIQAFALLANGLRALARDAKAADDPAWKLDVCCIPSTDGERIRDKLDVYFRAAWDAWENLVSTFPSVAGAVLGKLSARYFNEVADVRQRLAQGAVPENGGLLESAVVVFQEFILALHCADVAITSDTDVRTEASVNLKSVSKGIAPWIIPCAAFGCRWKLNGGCAAKLGFFPWEAVILATVHLAREVRVEDLWEECIGFLREAYAFEYPLPAGETSRREMARAMDRLGALALVELGRASHEKKIIRLTPPGQRMGEIWHGWWRDRRMFSWIMGANCQQCYSSPFVDLSLRALPSRTDAGDEPSGTP